VAAAAHEPAAPINPPAAEPAPATIPAAPASPAAAAPSAAKPAEPAPQPAEPAASVPTLLETFDKEKADKEAAKTAEAKPAEPAEKPAEPAVKTPQAQAPDKPGDAPPAPVALAPVEYKYTLPETIQLDDALRTEVHSAFDHFRADPSAGAQELINLHEKQMRQFAEFMASEQQRIFKETRQNWQKQILADPEIGGSGHQTAMGAIARMRDLFVPEKERPAFDEFLRATGAGDNPAFMKMLHQAARYYDEPTLPPANPRPTSTNGQRPSRRLRDIYDHPRSTAEGRS
jgi:hypothetical protein